MDKNPFLIDLVASAHWVKKRDVAKSKEDLEENEYFEFESEDYTRLYRGLDKLERFNVLLKLMPSALQLFTWILYYLPKNSDVVKMDDLDLSIILDLSCSQIQRARIQLKEENIIRHKKESAYWINPKYFFCGNRLKMYPDNKAIKVRKVEDEYKPLGTFDALTNRSKKQRK